MIPAFGCLLQPTPRQNDLCKYCVSDESFFCKRSLWLTRSGKDEVGSRGRDSNAPEAKAATRKRMAATENHAHSFARTSRTTRTPPRNTTSRLTNILPTSDPRACLLILTSLSLIHLSPTTTARERWTLHLHQTDSRECRAAWCEQWSWVVPCAVSLSRVTKTTITLWLAQFS